MKTNRVDYLLKLAVIFLLATSAQAEGNSNVEDDSGRLSIWEGEFTVDMQRNQPTFYGIAIPGPPFQTGRPSEDIVYIFLKNNIGMNPDI